MNFFLFLYMIKGEYVIFFDLPPERLDSKKEILTQNLKTFSVHFLR